MSVRDVDWKHELIDQMDFQWNRRLLPRIGGLTDEEYLWEPVANCWNVHPQTDKMFSVELQTWPEPVPPPFTTIAWRMVHLMNVFGTRQ